MLQKGRTTEIHKGRIKVLERKPQLCGTFHFVTLREKHRICLKWGGGGLMVSQRGGGRGKGRILGSSLAITDRAIGAAQKKWEEGSGRGEISLPGVEEALSTISIWGRQIDFEAAGRGSLSKTTRKALKTVGRVV